MRPKSKKYSQAEARRMARELESLRERLSAAQAAYCPKMEGVRICSFSLSNLPAELSALKTASVLGFAIAAYPEFGSVVFKAFRPGEGK